MKAKLVAFADCQSGATAIEYALIASGIAMAVVVIAGQLGTTLNGRYAAVKTALN